MPIPMQFKEPESLVQNTLQRRNLALDAFMEGLKPAVLEEIDLNSNKNALITVGIPAFHGSDAEKNALMRRTFTDLAAGDSGFGEIHLVDENIDFEQNKRSLKWYF